MKLLPDLSLFHRHAAMIRNEKGTRIYHAGKQKQISLYQLTEEREHAAPLWINALFQGRFDRRYYYRQSNCPWLGVEYVREGSLAARSGERAWLIEPGEAFFLLPFQDSEMLAGPEGYCVKDSFPIHGGLVGPLLSLTGLGKEPFAAGFDREKLEILLEELLSPEAAGENVPSLANNRIAYEIINVLAYSKAVTELNGKLAELHNFMRKNLARPLPVRELAELCGVSETTLRQNFHAAYGQSPHQVLTGMRMKEAARLLLAHGELSVKEIAALTGFPDALNFSTAFRRHHGLSPRKFRASRLCGF